MFNGQGFYLHGINCLGIFKPTHYCIFGRIFLKTSFDKVFGQSVYNTVAGMNKYFLRMVQFTKVCQQKSVLTPFSDDDAL